MDRRGLLRSISFGERVAEDETDGLADYFVETDLWHRLYRGNIDIVYGAKGSGKSALYSLLLAKTSDLLERRIILVAGENPRGATAFRDLTIDPPAGEREFAGLWKLYVTSLLHSALADHQITNDATKELTKLLARDGLVKGQLSLAGLLRVVFNYARRALRPDALEGGFELDPLTQLPKGFRGKITFSEPVENTNSELRSVDSLLLLAERALSDAGFAVWITLDRLDVAFADAPDLEANALRALFRVYLDSLAWPSIHIKVFLRSDIWARITSSGFREASHITRHLTISWSRTALLNLIVRRLLHNEAICSQYSVDDSLGAQSVESQERFFYRLCPDQVDFGSHQPSTTDWLLLRTRDGTKATAPREVIHFLNCLRDVQVRKMEVGQVDIAGERLFSPDSFREALPEVSRVRLEQTLFAEHPNQRQWLDKLRGASAFQTPATLALLWAIPPEEVSRHCTDLVDIGFFEPRGTRREPEYWVPFLYSDALDMLQGPAGTVADLADRLRQYLTPTTPLGPIDATQMVDIAIAARMYDAHNRPFSTLLRRDLAVVIGRRGSGKTALLNSYKYRPYLDTASATQLGVSPRSDFRAYETVVEILTYKQFDDMQRVAARDPSAFRPVEAIVDDWETLLVDYFLATFVGDEINPPDSETAIDFVRRYLQQESTLDKEEQRRGIWGLTLWSKVRSRIAGGSLSNQETPITRDMALQAVVELLTERRRRAIILLDSMDEYDTRNPGFARTLGALIRFITHFNQRQERVKIKLALPLEILPEIQRASANPLKDFVSIDHIQWGAIELAQITAHRYRLFLSVYDRHLADQLARFDLNKRGDVREFWSLFFVEKQLNEYGTEEEPLTYVMRHTQLLPRQVLMLFQKIIVGSAAMSGGYRAFKSDAVSGAIDSMYPLIAAEIFGAFRQAYPFAEDVGRAVFAGSPAVFSYDQLEDRWRKKGRPAARVRGESEVDMVSFVELLTRIGVLGVVHDETATYYEAQFGYDSLAPASIGEGHLLCLHPVFGKVFGAAATPKRKAVIPVGTSIG